MIDLFSVKLNKKYDFIGEFPNQNGTWLCSEAQGDYIAGYSYLINGNNVTRIEITEDFKITSAIQPTVDIVKKFLNWEKPQKRCFNQMCVPFWQEKCEPLPSAVELIISKMIYYDIFQRGESTMLKSENIGNYSYTTDDYIIGGLVYPKDIVYGLELYKKVSFI